MKLAELSAEVFPLGSWKNIIEMEECLTLDELYLLRDGMYKTDHRRHRFMAALKGISLDGEDEEGSSFEDVEARAQAMLSGQTEEEFSFKQMGIEIESDDED